MDMKLYALLSKRINQISKKIEGVDDETLDELHEIVDRIKENDELYEKKENKVTNITDDDLSDENKYPNVPALIDFFCSNTPVFYSFELEILPEDWEDNVATITDIEGVTTDNIIFVTPAANSMEAWSANGVYCAEQEDGVLTFNCLTPPEDILTLKCLIYDTFAYGDEVGY